MAAFFVKVSQGYLVSDSVPVLLACNRASRGVDMQALNEYWFLDFCIPPKTIWRDIQAVPNGHTAELSLESGRKPVYEQNWVPGLTANGAELLSSDTAPAALRSAILEETQRVIDSTPNGFVNLLSGGVDSSVVVAACHILGHKPRHAITFKGVGDSDESGLAAKTARHLGISLEILSAEANDLVADAHRVVGIWGQPYAHGSVHAMQELLKTVPAGCAVFTGDGGGEAFAGTPARLSPFRWVADPVFVAFNALPCRLRRNMYRTLSARPFAGRALAYMLELKGACNEGQWQLRSGPITQWETEAVMRPDKLMQLSKPRIEGQLYTLANRSALPGESLFARSLAFWWSSEGVYAKTWRLLDAEGLVGIGPLTGPRFYETVKRIPVMERGERKQALREAFADVLPSEVLTAPKRGLRPLNRELLAEQADAGIAWITDGASETWDALFDRETIKSFWLSHRDGKVFRSNLLYKAVIFRAWCDYWQPEFSEDLL
jgi:asparagine synthetase B (glutamine-hydrolysing)